MRLAVVIVAAAIHIHSAACHPTTSNTFTTDSSAYHSAQIDYAAVDSLLRRASRQPLHHRIAKFFAIELHRDSTTYVRSCRVQLFPAYSSELGWFIRSGIAIGTASRATLAVAVDYGFDGDYRILLAGANRLGLSNRITYDIEAFSLPVEFWGVDNRATNPQWYRRKEYIASFRWRHSYPSHFFIGALFSFRTAKAEFAPSADYATATQIGFEWGYDSRNREQNSERGLYLDLRHSAILLSEDTHHIAHHTLIMLRGYQPLWRGGCWASELYAEFFTRNTPWLFAATTDGTHRLRAYAFGRYTGRVMLSLQSELRQHLFGSFHIAMWSEVGELAERLCKLGWRNILPSFGAGLRIDIGKTGRLRFDYAIGSRSTNFTVSFNEAF